ncbi:MAG: cytochrome C oxidase subunit IV family protein [Chloroflexi bacterium]|nr:cytochrome C oxidase subunit IV family protein [Chloroflexota bacterium]
MEATHSQSHPPVKTRDYLIIFVWLIVITGAEVAVGTLLHDILPPVITYPILFLMAVVKSALVALYYMHLRHDSRWFLLFVGVSLPLAVLFILVMVLGFARIAP